MMVRIAGLILLVASILVVPLTHAQTMPQTGPQPGGPQDTTIKDPRSRAKLHTELGTLYFQDRNVPVAMEELTIAIYIDPTYAPAYGMRALVHNYLREPQHAEDNFREALRYAPDDPEIANNYGWFLCQNGKYKEGLAQLERALRSRLYQTPERAYVNAGQCAMAMGDIKQAEEYLDRALRFSAGNPLALFYRVELFYRTGRLEAAKSEMAELMRKIDPTSEVLWLALRIERKLGDRESESRYATQLRRRFPASNEYQELLKGNFE